ncbi:hypothetical protein [Serratia oryzae]|uniref:Fimbrial-type adhesion domain-containing protein n=1 Tax=Serratia oryzae TaxID=2034155 RepID=A0A1S8CLR0_9GAMM|nr:hypothetical protein [Serratia oryzae]OMQ23684.1 hypothetical protein BMI79_09220 [Serratia oryzae]
MSRSLIYKFILLLLMSIGASFSAQALECHLNTWSGKTRDFQPIGQLKIPTTTAIGTRLWTSPPMQIMAFCWADPAMPNGEFVYFYPNAFLDEDPFPPGISVGLIYDGKDLGIIRNREKTDNYVYLYPDNPKNRAYPVNFQVYLQKTGDIAVGPITIDQLSAFQLDGEQGINTTAIDQNYRYILTGLNNIEIIPCSASIQIDPPSGVAFGEIRGWSANDGKVAEKEFNIVATKNDSCDLSFQLNASYELKANGQAKLVDATGIDIGNGATLRLRDNTYPKDIRFNQIEFFADMSGKRTLNKSYTASLWANGDPVEGPFSTTLILRVNYL